MTGNRLRAAAAVLLLCVLTGCLVLSGQRITWRYDAESDKLHFLIHYDGIYDNLESAAVVGRQEKDETLTKSRAEIAAAVANGHLMLLDWFGVVQQDKIAARLDDDAAIPAHVRPVLEHVRDHLGVKILGRYRDSRNRIGVVQHVEIGAAKELQKRVNLMIDGTLRNELGLSGDPRIDAIAQRWIDVAVEGGHQWLDLDGNAILVRLPARRGDADLAKAEAAAEILKLLRRGDPTPKISPDDVTSIQALIQSIAGAPVSILQERSELVVRLGYRDAPATWRVAMREGYKANLEAAIETAVPTEVDRALAARVLGDAGAQNIGELEPLHAWGPAEAQVRAVLWYAQSGGADRRKRVASWLRQFGKQIDADGDGPRAPATDDDDAAYIDSWRAWHARALAHPRVKIEPDAGR